MDEVFVIEPVLAALTRLTAALKGLHVNVTAVQSDDAVAAARRLGRRRPAAIIATLTGDEPTVDVRAMLEESRGTRFILLVPTMPPRAAVARVASANGAVLLDKAEPDIVTVSTLVTLLARQEHYA